MKGVAIMKVYNINRNETALGETMIRTDYSQTRENYYDFEMTVSISDLPLAPVEVNPHCIWLAAMWVKILKLI